VAKVFAGASVEGLVMTSISSPQRSNVTLTLPRTAPEFRSPLRICRCAVSHGDSSCGLNVWDPPRNWTVTSTEFKTFSVLRRALYWAAGICRVPSLMSRAVPMIRPSAGFAGWLPPRR
jgi:hypothetical protein